MYKTFTAVLLLKDACYQTVMYVEGCVNMTKPLARYSGQTESKHYDSMTASHT